MKVLRENAPSEFLSTETTVSADGIRDIILHADEGKISCKFHLSPEGSVALLLVGGMAGGFDGPARGLYPRLAKELLPENISSLRLNYRYHNNLRECISDVQSGIKFLKASGKPDVILIGHSFGGAVVVSTGASTENVIGVVAMSSQSHGTISVKNISPRPLLIIHGEEDAIIPESCSRDLNARAAEPKQLIIYPGGSHGLDECENVLDKDIINWIQEILNK